MELSSIKGLGEKRIESLKKAGFLRPEDLLFFFPKKYLDTDNLSKTAELKPIDEALFFARLISEPIRKNVRKGLFFVRAEFALCEKESSTIKTSQGADESPHQTIQSANNSPQKTSANEDGSVQKTSANEDGSAEKTSQSGEETITCIWFNNKYIKSSLRAGSYYYISGKTKKRGRKVELSSPQLYDGSLAGIVPVYPSVGGLAPTLIRKIIADVLNKVTMRGYLSEELSQRYGILPLQTTVKILHNPSSMLEIEKARKSAALEILACELATFFLHKDSNSRQRVFSYKTSDSELKNFIDTKLPFALTQSQKDAIDEIISSFRGGQRMNRLLQGDVGSGKTVVALIAMYFAYLSGYQSVLMSPTEILARQHFLTASKIFDRLGVRICLLTGSLSRAERADKLFNIKNGLYDFIIGTHALIQEDVEFSRLSLIVTDEQQRFGVEQRGKLENKALGTDCLTLTATPIPRTLAMTLYGELEQSAIERIHTKRAETFTRLVPTSKLDNMYDYIANKAENGEKTYIVCPRIEDEDEELFSVKEVYAQLKRKARLAPYLSMLHGQMREEEKSHIMESFKNGRIRVLISTTVVEVGIDVPDATSIIIFNPERFGLSQLHQLRGRVGRGQLDSYCFLVTSEENRASETLNFFLGCNDGFELAEYDFKSRGAGDFLGFKQHGGSKILNFPLTIDIVITAKKISTELLGNDSIKNELLSALSGEKISYIKNITLN